MKAFTLEEIEPTFETRYGVKVQDVGEDGDVLMLGHVDERRALAAWLRHAREMWGYRRSDIDMPPTFKRKWAVFTDHHDGCAPALETGHYADCLPEYRVNGDCDCRDECNCDEYGWWATWSDAERVGSIAVTVVSQ